MGPLARGDLHPLRRRPAHAQLRDQPVPVAAVGRDRELDHVARGRARDALEQESRRVERDPQRLGLLLVRDRGLDRLRAAGDLGTLLRALEEERHFALVGGLRVSNLGSL